jgi:acetyl-CoA carboxylase biotin carboxyl carrier protein
MDIKEIKNLIKFVAASGASEVKLETEGMKITIRTGQTGSETEPTTVIQQLPPMPQMQAEQAATQATQQTAPAPEAAAKDDDSQYTVIKSPIIGTFYRKPSPDKPVFKEVGDNVAVGDVLCVIEAMKLFNEIESEVSGKIVKVLADDASPVEFDQPLFLIDPS